MNQKSKKMNDLISQNRVKLHLFETSQREIWTIVGKEKEHWIDPASNFCIWDFRRTIIILILPQKDHLLKHPSKPQSFLQVHMAPLW